MWQYILTINLRRALRMKFHQMAGLTGLVVAFTVSAAIFLYLHNELSYETGYQHSNHIYRVILHGKMGGSEFDAAVCGAPMGPHFMAEIPGVKAFTRLFNIPGTKLVSFEDKKIYEEQILYVDSMFFRVFGHSFLEGDETNCLNEPNTIVLVKSFAEKYFSNQPALGRILTLDGKKYKVTGVVSNPDQPTHLRFNGLISLSTLNDHPRYGQYLKTPFAFITTTYLLLRPGLKPTDIQTNIDRVVDKYMNFPDSAERVSSEQERMATMSLQSIRSIHLHSNVLHELEPNSDVSIVYIYAGVAMLLIAIALINYFNIATASAIRRGREISIHKILGAGKRVVVWQFFSETAIQVGLAILVSAAVLPAAWPALRYLMGGDGAGVSTGLLVMYYAALFAVGLCAGVYPALVVSAISPLAFIKKFTVGSSSSYRVRSVLVGFQFLMAMLLVSGALLAHRQLSFMLGKEKGFNPDRVLVVPLRDRKMYQQVDVLMREMGQLPVVEGVAASSAWPGNFQHRKGFQPEGFDADDPWMILFIDVSPGFTDLMGIKIKEGRGFSHSPGADSLGILVNESLVKKTGWKTIAGKTITNPADGKPEIFQVIGTVEDFNFSSLHETVKPLLIRSNATNFRFLLIKLKPATEAGIGFDRVRLKWEGLFPGFPFEGFMLPTKLNSLYSKESRTSKAVTVFTLIALLIASVGLFDMATNMAMQSNRENSIRKVLGGSARSIIVRQTIRYIKPVVWSAVLAIPFFWYFGSEWLSQFEYRTHIDFGLLFEAVFVVFVTSMATTLGVAWSASRRNPLDGIREE